MKEMPSQKKRCASLEADIRKLKPLIDQNKQTTGQKTRNTKDKPK